MSSLNKIKYGFLAVVVLAGAVAGFALFKAAGNTRVVLAEDETISNTPISVERLRQIGQWEFLSITDEELVDTTRRHLLGDDHLVRIYYGQLSLGIDMGEMAVDAIEVVGDSVTMFLPEVKLLDEAFIDEARTQAFYESGKWSGKDYEALYLKARRQMKQRCLTEENLNQARENAKAEMRKMLAALGVEKVNLR